jgi:hypothetical protein
MTPLPPPFILYRAKLPAFGAMDKSSTGIGHFNQDGFIFCAQVYRGYFPRGRQFEYAAVEVQNSRIGDSHEQKIGSKKPSKNGVIHTNAGRALKVRR